MEYKSFHFLVKFIPRYFILFDAIVNGIFFLISISDSSFLVYKNLTDQCIVIFYPETLLNSLISSNIFWGESSELYILSHHLNQQQFYFFPIQMHFIPFSIVESKSSSTMLNKHGETGHFCLVPDLRGEDFSFLPLSVIFTRHLL